MLAAQQAGVNAQSEAPAAGASSEATCPAYSPSTGSGGANRPAVTGVYPAAAEGQTSRLQCIYNFGPISSGCQQLTCRRQRDGQLGWDLGECASLTPCSYQPGRKVNQTCVVDVVAQCAGLDGDACDKCVDDAARASNSLAAQAAIVFVVFAWPCVMFSCSHYLCIKRHAARSAGSWVPSENAWMISASCFSIAFLALFIGNLYGWVVFGTLMVTPFWFKDCYISEEQRDDDDDFDGFEVSYSRRPVPPTTAAVSAESVAAAQVTESINPVSGSEIVVVAGTVLVEMTSHDAEDACPASSVQDTVAIEHGDDNSDDTPYSPTHTRVSLAGSKLTEFLTTHSLLQYEPVLREMGAVCVDDLRNITTEELADECGMKILEVKRLWRGLASSATGGAVQAAAGESGVGSGAV